MGRLIELMDYLNTPTGDESYNKFYQHLTIDSRLKKLKRNYKMMDKHKEKKEEKNP